MPIPLPNLDDRRWADLVEDGRAQITRYAPQWTDHNIHDPGITLIDLFAWLGEMADYRLNRTPSRHKRKFLGLLGFAVEGPTPANATLSFAPAPGTAPFVLPAGSEFEGMNPDRVATPFRTLRDTTVMPSVLTAVQVDDGSGTPADRTHDFLDGFPIQALGATPEAGSVLYLGFDALTPGLPFALGLRFAGPGNDAAERKRILDEAGEEAVLCEPVRTRIQCGPAAMGKTTVLPPHHSVRTVWEAFTSSGWTAIAVNDDTRSLTLDGIVEVTLPANITQAALGAVALPLFYVRCRMTGGMFDAIPVLLDAAVNAAPSEQAAPVTTSFGIQAGIAPSGAPPTPGDAVQLALTMDGNGVIQSFAFGTGTGPRVHVWTYTAPGASAGEITLEMELAGVGTGLPDQLATLRTAPLDADSFELYTLGTAWQQWTVRDDFGAATRTAFDCVLDAVAGTVTFGSGERGQTPAPDSLILVRYRATAADNGNLGRGVVDRARKSPINSVLLKGLPPGTRGQLKTITTNRASATGGAAAETLSHALGRAVEALHAHERLLEVAVQRKTLTLDQVNGEVVRSLAAPSRGVNLLDLERIALAAPGTRVDRSRAWASLHPSYPCLDAPGVVTVVIVPEYPLGMPAPSQGLIDRVWWYLNRRRMVCTSLEVVGPQYVEVTVTATVKVRTGASAAKVGQRIQASLRAYLDPLTGGPDSLGWPFGRSVYRSEILQLMQDVPGVDYVAEMSMRSDEGGQAPAQCGDIALCPTTLTRSGAHQIEVL